MAMPIPAPRQPSSYTYSQPVSRASQKWGANKGHQHINNDIKLPEFHSCWLWSLLSLAYCNTY